MDLGLKGRVAIVTGGSKGIGRAIAHALIREGVKLVMCARDRKALAEARREIGGASDNLIAVSADVTDRGAVAKVVRTAIERFGGLDILVNNAGGARRFGDFSDLREEEWLEAFKLNVMSVVCFVRDALPWLRKSRAARIVNISSISGVEPGSYNPHYTITKAAVINLTKYLANQLANDGILVNVVCPGPVYSDSWNRNIQRIASLRNISSEAARVDVEANEVAKIPLGRIGRGGDVAGLVAFLVSDQAAWITGSCFHVNGGKLRSMC